MTATTTAINAAGLAAALTASDSEADGGAGSGHLKLTSATAGESSKVTIAGGSFGGLAALIKMGLANGGREFNADAEHRPSA